MEICRVDIMTKVSMTASQIEMPSEGQLETVLNVFGFLRQKYN